MVCDKHGTSLGEFYYNGKLYKASYSFSSHESHTSVDIYSNDVVSADLNCANIYSSGSSKSFGGSSDFYRDKVEIEFLDNDLDSYFKVTFVKDESMSEYACGLSEDALNQEFFTEDATKMNTGDGSVS